MLGWLKVVARIAAGLFVLALGMTILTTDAFDEEPES